MAPLVAYVVQPQHMWRQPWILCHKRSYLLS